jgi:hypothetical protein
MKVLIISVSLLFIPAYSDDLIVLGKGHAPIYVSNTDSGRFDFDNNGSTDYYVKAHYTGNSHQPLKIDYEIQDECVDLGPKDASNIGGDTFDDAAMKIGFSKLSNPFVNWLVDDINVWNPWFKSKNNDDNKLIDLAFVSPTSTPYFDDDTRGDDVIVGSGKQGSFQHFSSIKELDGQSGWEGSVFLNAPPGDYLLWTIHPGDGYGDCDTLTGLGIPIFITN